MRRIRPLSVCQKDSRETGRAAGLIQGPNPRAAPLQGAQQEVIYCPAANCLLSEEPLCQNHFRTRVSDSGQEIPVHSFHKIFTAIILKKKKNGVPTQSNRFGPWGNPKRPPQVRVFAGSKLRNPSLQSWEPTRYLLLNVLGEVSIFRFRRLRCTPAQHASAARQRSVGLPSLMLPSAGRHRPDARLHHV
ncbi:unnamed protein product [Merluccius merluccius]